MPRFRDPAKVTPERDPGNEGCLLAPTGGLSGGKGVWLAEGDPGPEPPTVFSLISGPSKYFGLSECLRIDFRPVPGVICLNNPPASPLDHVSFHFWPVPC